MGAESLPGQVEEKDVEIVEENDDALPGQVSFEATERAATAASITSCRPDSRGTIKKTEALMADSEELRKQTEDKKKIRPESGNSADYTLKEKLENMNSSGALGRKQFAGVGFCSDMTIRLQRQSDDEEKKKGKPNAAMLMLLMSLSGDRDALAANPQFQHARSIVVREDLTQKLTARITNEFKSKPLNKGGWAKTSLQDLQAVWARMIETKKEQVLIHTEVKNKLVLYKLLNTHSQEVKEPPKEKNYRMQEYFKDYQDRARDPTPMMPQSLVPLNGKMQKAASAVDIQVLRGPRTSNVYPLVRKGPGRLPTYESPDPDNPAKVTITRGFRDRNEKTEITKAPKEKDRLRFGMSWCDESPTQAWGLTYPAIGARRRAQLEIPSGKDDTRIGATIRSSSSTAKLPKIDHVPQRKTSIHESVEAARKELPPIVDGMRQAYFRHCDNEGVRPSSLPFLTGHTDRLEAAHRDITDRELDAIAKQIPECNGIVEVDLTSNGRLTDISVASLLKRLMREPTVSELLELKLAQCQRLSYHTFDNCTKLLQMGHEMQVLNLAGIQIAVRFQVPLCQAIGNHPKMRDVNLSSVGLVDTDRSTRCCASLLSSRSIEVLDLSWNSFDYQVFGSFGFSLGVNRVVRNLSLSHCTASFGMVTSDVPMNYFFEQLCRNRSLTRLDVTTNKLDYKAALVLEEGMQLHTALTKLTISENPLGTCGLRSIIRLLCSDLSGLVELESAACQIGAAGAEGEPVFSSTDPSGKYKFRMESPYHRAMVRKLYQTCDRFGMLPDQAFSNTNHMLKGKSEPYVHAQKDGTGMYEVLTEGVLRLVFNVESGMKEKLKHIGDQDFAGFMVAYNKMTRVEPSFRKVIPLFFTWYRMKDKDLEQRCFIDAISKEFSIKISHLSYLVEADDSFATQVLLSMLPCIPQDQFSRYLAVLMFPRITEFLAAHKTMTAFFDFNVNNPTGHYKLDLGEPTNYAVAETLLLLDRWESSVDDRLNRFDTSQRGNRSHFRNEAYQGRPLADSTRSLAEWTLPEWDTFEFDYISSARPPEGSNLKLMNDDMYDEMLVMLYRSNSHPDDKVKSLRNVSSYLYITSMQMRTLLGNFPSEEQRNEAFIIFFLRIVDIHNAKLFGVRFTKYEETVKLRERLGYAAYFPFFQPENQRFELNFKDWDQRVCLSILVKISLMEKPLGGNIRDPVYIRGDGIQDELPLGVPRSWEQLDRVPESGTFSCCYVCAPEDRKFAGRKDLSALYSYFIQPGLLEEDVRWCTGLAEAPTEVIDYLEWLIGKGFKDSSKAFTAIDGPGGNGVITLREFEESFVELDCQKFAGPDEHDKLLIIFRYLDPGGEGSVSADEWDVIGQLWKEFELSVKEFVQFLVRVFGLALEDSWGYLDDDGSGELDEAEWLAAVAKIGYFGPAKVVFALLDNSDDGNISWDEFKVLEKYLPVAGQEDAQTSASEDVSLGGGPSGSSVPA